MSGVNKALAYTRQQGSHQLVERHAGLVRRIAQHLLARLPDSVLLDDLVQSGMVGLLEAARNFDGSKGASFETFAGIRIRGAMLDEIRRGDWVPRSVHRNGRQIAEAMAAVQRREGRHAQDREVAAELGVSLEQYHAMLADVSNGRILEIEEFESGIDAQADISQHPAGPFEGMARERFLRVLADSIKTLPEREALVLSLYYDEELNLKEIGQVLEVSESRVSQIHSQAMLRLKSRLRDWQN
ncbi:RNA polymerase sigma factor FliA [Zobellella denitrificans]|jgi:RNA polymerase sigma factor for flagellar operon FliA|uniref:RNA polymerase sigma factor FliA n=1 Tax=Zobellella denitrificans TaxID=347534 RepID=A0A231MY99_9GAMM|nr:RNA polymerase sigma factor FliA [Zobellella denitrificans]ATG73212.1 RNA polymerase subunit sigma-70 [Zobellella denitrificans]OXS15138.1 RNA polymerase sigma factor FliA [Zobellella denitrificans]